LTIAEILTALDARLRADQAITDTPSGHRVEYLYAIDAQASLQVGVLTIRLLARERRADGTWDRPIPAVISDEAALLTSATDRRLLGPLLGARRVGAPAPSDASQNAALVVTLPDALALDWIPLAARAGRLLLRDTPDSTSTRLLQWDDGPVWTFRIEAEEDDSDHLLRGVFARAHDTLPVTGPVLVRDVGLFITHERVAYFDPGSSPGVVSVMRTAGTLVVPDADTSRLAQWLSRYGVPSEALPPRLRIEPVRASPVPHLRLAPVLTGDWLDATLSFLYDGTPVGELDPSPFFDEARQRFIYRSPDDEETAEAQLITSGASVDSGSWRVATKALTTVVSELTTLGWTVEADGVPYRAAGPMRLSVTSGIDWFDLNAVVAYGDVSATLPELLAALDRGDRTIRLGDGSLGVLPEEWLRRYTPLTAIGTLQPDGTIRYRTHQAALLDALLESQNDAAIEVDDAFAQLRDRLATASHPEAMDPPASFRGELRSYQREALGWIQFLRHFSFGGCLADDMGLGKTVTVLAELARVAGTAPRPSLVVVPRSVVHNWKAEAAKFTPTLRVLDYSDINRRQADDQLSEVDLVIVTYGTVRRDIEQLRHVQFEYVILDEAQAIKNASTEAAKAVRLLNSRFRLALSGTPIENHLGELWSLFEFLNPGLLGRASQFRKAAKGRAEDTVSLVARGLRPFLLRRTKAQVATELPARTEQTLTCELSPRERSFYDALRRHYRQSLLAHVSKVGVQRSGLQVLEALLRLRQAACHPGLIAPARQHESSSKIELLMERLQEVVEEGHKALVFSQFTSLLALVKPVMDAAKIPYEYMDGRTRDRGPRIERFQTDPNCPVFLVSLKAGGVGLNLTAADYVFLLDPWWNPAVEAQAIDRTHRIGQTKEVFAYRIIAENTVEEKVLALQDTKRALADAVLSANPVGLAGLSASELEFLLG
jgi:superfamily II DNA or RNA helicase